MASSSQQPWGRLLIAGGTDFATLGRKDKSGKALGNPDRPDLGSAHIVRNVANVKFKRIFASHSGCHAVALTVDDQAYLIGRNEHYQLSHPLPPAFTTAHLTSDGIPSPTPAATYPFPLLSFDDMNAPRALKKQRIVSAAVGRGHTVLVTENGDAWTAGWNVAGQCGHPESEEHISSFKRVKGDLADEKVVAASCGTMHTLFLTEKGEVYAVGTGEKGVLGNGSTGEHIAGSRVLFTVQSEPLLVEGALEGKKIVQITSGQQHNIAMDNEGYCYAWGFGGLGRLGIGAQMDALVPVQIPQFAGANPLTRCKKISAGSHCTLFIDRQDMVLLCGKWKTSGDGSSGQPWMTPRLVHEIQGYKMKLIASGGVTLFANSVGDKRDGELTVAWGQNAQYKELALGEGAAKSATKPTRIDYLDGVDMLDIAAGQATTFFIARPPPTQVEKDEAKAASDPAALIASSAASSSTAAAAPPAPAEAAVPSSSTDSSTAPVKPAIDLSGFGFAFMPSPSSSSASSPAPVAAPPPAPIQAPAPSAASDVSKTHQAAWEELQRWPEVEFAEGADNCKVCGGFEADGVKGEILECEKCEGAYHTACAGLQGVPYGEWFCSACDLPSTHFPTDDDEQQGKKRKADEDEGEEAVAAKKQKE
ncbi:hypothetical protein JCM8547_001258 [Rhodosporidiobolus lusitaniae]